MIKSFRDDDTENIANGIFAKRLPVDIQHRAKMRLDRIDVAAELEDLRVPQSHRLEALRGKRKGQYSIRINDQWRICFVWKNGHAYDVEVVDYH